METTPRIDEILVRFWRLHGIWWRQFSWETVPARVIYRQCQCQCHVNEGVNLCSALTQGASKALGAPSTAEKASSIGKNQVAIVPRC